MPDRVLTNAYTVANITAHRTFSETHPITYRHAVATIERRNVSEEIKQTALTFVAAVLQSTDAARAGHADPLPGSAISAAIGVAITRAKSAVAASESPAATDIADVDESRLSDGAWLTMGTLNPETVATSWGTADTLAAVEDLVDLSAVWDAVAVATSADDARTTVESLAVRRAGCRPTDRRAVKIRAEIRATLAEARDVAATTAAWRTSRPYGTHAHGWTDDAADVAASLVQRPGMTRNSWSAGDRTTSGAASLVHVRRADGTEALLDPRNGVLTALEPANDGEADVMRAAILSAVVVPAWQRDGESRAADLYADAQEPLGAVAKANTRKSRRAGGVGGPVITGRSKPRRV